MKKTTLSANQINTYDLCVVGGGPAGMTAAIFAASNGCKVALIEKNQKLGKKLLITGKGRCNVTNNCSVTELLKNVTTNASFLYSAFNRFTAEDTISFFEELGVPLKTERGGRVFPISEKSADVRNALEKRLLSLGVTVINDEAISVATSDGQVKTLICKNHKIACSSVILATGGCSYPLTGSDGYGFKMAEMAGHTVIPVRPSLVPLDIRGKMCERLMGLTLNNVTLTLFDKDNKRLYSELGEMLFTHFGVSGPLVLSASVHIKPPYDGYYVLVDLKPALSREQLDKRIQRDFNANINKDFVNALSELLPNKLIPEIVELSGIDPRKKVNVITKEERLALADCIKNMRLDIVSPRGFEEAVVTSGGVSVSEINPKTMESKLVKGLYFAGEVIDTDAYTGGFNLQIAFSTGYAAGSSIYPKEEE